YEHIDKLISHEMYGLCELQDDNILEIVKNNTDKLDIYNWINLCKNTYDKAIDIVIIYLTTTDNLDNEFVSNCECGLLSNPNEKAFRYVINKYDRLNEDLLC